MMFIVASERDGGEGERPDAVVDFFEGHVFAGQRTGDKLRRAFPRDAPIAADESHLAVAGILERRQSPRQRSRRGFVAARRRLILRGFVRALVVVLRAKTDESSLLRGRSGRRRPGSVRLQDRMKLFMRSVLFGMPRRNAFRDNAQANPPDRELRESGQTRTGEGPAVVAANAFGQPVFGERAFEAAPRGTGRPPEQRIAAQHEPAEAAAIDRTARARPRRQTARATCSPSWA